MQNLHAFHTYHSVKVKYLLDNNIIQTQQPYFCHVRNKLNNSNSTSSSQSWGKKKLNLIISILQKCQWNLIVYQENTKHSYFWNNIKRELRKRWDGKHLNLTESSNKVKHYILELNGLIHPWSAGSQKEKHQNLIPYSFDRFNVEVKTHLLYIYIYMYVLFIEDTCCKKHSSYPFVIKTKTYMKGLHWQA